MSNHPFASLCAACLADREVNQPEGFYDPGAVKMEQIVPAEVADFAVEAAAILPEALMCVCCNAELSTANQNTQIADCSPHCKQCLARWAETQILSGNSLCWKCLCGAHKLTYKDFRSLSGLLSSEAKTIYHNAHRQAASVSGIPHVQLECPDCHEVNDVYVNMVTYRCTNHPEHQICVRHNVRHTRPLVDRGDGRIVVDIFATPSCAKCLEASGGNAVVSEILRDIQTVLCDRCYACKG